MTWPSAYGLILEHQALGGGEAVLGEEVEEAERPS